MYNNNFVLLSDGNDVVIKDGESSYKLAGCIMTSVSLEHEMNYDTPMAGIRVSIELVANEYASGDDIDLSGNNKINKLLEVAGVKFGQSSRKLDI